MSAESLELTGWSLSLQDVEGVALRRSPELRLAAKAREHVVAARAFVERALTEQRTIYGVTTGFGALSDIVIPLERIAELQINLIRSHSAGTGAALPEAETRAVMLLRANVLACGHSGVRPELIDLLLAMLNRGVHPIIPEYGSVGASGDLAPLSHLALTMIGEGEAVFAGERLQSGEALRRAGLNAITLEAKEGLALINGTQVQTAIGVLALLAAERAVETAEVAGAMSLEALRGTPDAFDAAIQDLRPHAGQKASADRLRALLEDSEIRESHRHGDPRVQDAYSIRCMPQIHGAARQGLEYARTILTTETNSVTDNPLIFADTGRVLSGGNFHGQPVAQVLDVIAMVCADLGAVSERRLARLVDPALSGLPAFLSPDPGVNSGLMMAQIGAAALVAELRLRAHPASVDSVPTDANKEDHVSMGVGAALKARVAVQLLETVLALELLAAAQGLEFLKPLRPGRGVAAAHEIVRGRVAPLGRDRELAPDIRAVEELVRAGRFAGLWQRTAPVA
jgi:histidine ammonia-lyase